MALGILRNGVPLDQVFGTKGASTAATTGLQQNGIDLNQYLLALADGQALGFASGVQKNGADFNTIFGRPNSNTPLSINGNTYTHSYTIPPSSTGSSSIGFRIVSGTTWQVYYFDSATSPTAITSGSIPAGAVSVKFTFGTPNVPSGFINASGTTNNTASTPTTVSSNPAANYTTATVSSTSGSRALSYPFTIDFYNSSSVDISTTNITLVGETEGSV